jgi:hypothetical protein
MVCVGATVVQNRKTMHTTVGKLGFSKLLLFGFLTSTVKVGPDHLRCIRQTGLDPYVLQGAFQAYEPYYRLWQCAHVADVRSITIRQLQHCV